MSSFSCSKKGYIILPKEQPEIPNLDFGDGDLLDGLTGGDGHLDLIKVHVHDDN